MANNINYEVDENDTRLTSIKSEESTELSNLEQTYADMETNTDKHYDSQIKGWEDYGKKQTELQNQSHKLTVQGIEQNKADAKKDYIKEQSGAYVDWQRQSNEYGANAEQMAASGLTNTGFSESSQVSMYNTYQNRIMTARESFDRAIVDYNNQIAQAKIANDTLLAEIAFNTLQKTTELAIQQAQYKNQLLMDLTEKRTALKSSYWQRYSDMMTTIQREIAQKEEARVNDAQIAYTEAQTAKAKKDAELAQAQIDKLKYGSGSGGGSGGGSKTKKTKYEVKTGKSISGSSSLPSQGSVGQALGIDLDSALKTAGGGAPSGKTLADMVNSGKATTTTKNGTLTFKPSGKWITDNMLYSKHGFD